jgi:acyl carrier protein
MTDKADTLERVRAVLVKKYSLTAEDIKPESTLESLKLDSLDLVEALFEMEDEFHVRIPQDRGAAVSIATIQDIVNIVNTMLTEQPPALQVDASHA